MLYFPSSYLASPAIWFHVFSEPNLHFYSNRQTGNRKEVGGILLGRIFSSHIVVDKATKPQLLDISNMFSFIRNPFGHQQSINKAWKSSQGTVNYLGEWHTHPELYPKPSTDDIQFIKETRSYKGVDYPTLMIIVGMETDLWLGLQSDNYLYKGTLYRI